MVKNVLHTTGDLSMVQSKKHNRIGFWNYANSFTGGQVLGQSIQAAGAGQIAMGNPVTGLAMVAAGSVPGALVKGTIDVNAQVRISGGGSNINVTGTAQSRPFPSVTGYAYTVNADGSINTKKLFYQDETQPSDLTMPMRPIN